MSEPVFQIFECENPTCKLRFPSNLSVTKIEICPLCGSSLQPSGVPFSNEKECQLSAASHSSRRINLLLDNLRSTLNVGSIFRTADGAGINHIYCCGTTPTPEHSKIKKTGLGAESFIPWSYHRNALSVVDNLDRNFSVCSLEASKESKSLFSCGSCISPDDPILLIVGNEISGIDPELLHRSSAIFAIPMLGSKTSLNVSIAVGIAVYVLRFH